MAIDKSLSTLLRALQSPTTEQDASRYGAYIHGRVVITEAYITRLLSSATTLLTLLSNPLNVTLLTSQLLTAPAVWHSADDLQAASRLVGVFSAASLEKIHQEQRLRTSQETLAREALSKEQWAIAVVRGADDKSPRWKHSLALGGLLIGFESHERHGLPLALRRKIEEATVQATNLALEEVENVGDLSSNVICMVLGYGFETLSSTATSKLRCDLLLPLLIETMLFSRNGLHWGYFLGIMDIDVSQNADIKFAWSIGSQSYLQIQKMASRPVVDCLGSLSRLASFCVANVLDDEPVFRTSDSVAAFTKCLCIQWQQNKLSEIDVSEESLYLSQDSMTESLPLLWQVLKSTLFTTIIIQTSILGRLIKLGTRPPVQTAIIATLALHALRDLYFISSRFGHNAFSQYSYVYLTSIDILSRYPDQAELFVRDILPTRSAGLPEHPQERNQDLYYLNVAEQFALFLPSGVCEELFLQVAYRYLKVGNDSRLLEIFEAAHSVVLAVFSCPQNYALAIDHLTFYISNLFEAFPQGLSSRQFRLAVRSLVRVTTPPSRIAESQPLLSSAILELLQSRISSGSTVQLSSDSKQSNGSYQTTVSEQATLILSLIDSLPFLPVPDLEEWLPLVARSLNLIEDSAMAQLCRNRLWEVMSNGEMDFARAQLCVEWWNTRGGRDMVFHHGSSSNGGPFMSGALGEASKL
ncbi:hypothetical protein MMC13_001875 [Lambiella insularis]|nr:hypothetical protein [Lambiella insularis]